MRSTIAAALFSGRRCGETWRRRRVSPVAGADLRYAFLAFSVEVPWHLPTKPTLPLNDFVAAA